MELFEIEKCFSKVFENSFAIYDQWNSTWLGDDDPIRSFENILFRYYRYYLLETWDEQYDTYFKILDPKTMQIKEYACTREVIDYEEGGTGDDYYELLTLQYSNIDDMTT